MNIYDLLKEQGKLLDKITAFIPVEHYQEYSDSISNLLINNTMISRQAIIDLLEYNVANTFIQQKEEIMNQVINKLITPMKEPDSENNL